MIGIGHPSHRQRVISYEVYLQARREYVTSLAHHYWQLRGCPEGSPEVDWFLAEQKADQDLLGEMELGLPA
jgi:hypothetical protein